MIDYNEDERVTLLKEKNVKARKSHTCYECRRAISVGERYLSEAFIWEGKLGEHKTCVHCCVVREWLNGQCGGFLYGDIEEDITEHAQSGAYPFSVGRLAAGMRRKWTKKNGALMNVPSGELHCD